MRSLSWNSIGIRSQRRCRELVAASRGPSRWRWLLPVLSTLLFYLVAYEASAWLFNVAIVPRRVPADLAALLSLSLLIFAAVAASSWFLILQALLIATLYVGSSAKSAIAGRPLMPEDILQPGCLPAPDGTLGLAGRGHSCLLILVLFIGNLRFRGHWQRAALAALVAVPVGAHAGSTTLIDWMDKNWGDKPWDQRENYVWRGGTMHLLQELVRMAAVATTGARCRHGRRRRLHGAWWQRILRRFMPGHPRNLHVVLEESFWDPAPLTAAGVKQSPLDPRFLALWDQAGRSTAMSPAFGGQTANAEFEVLCGFPLAQGAVRFEQAMNDAVPCLPRLLAQAGYRTVASHPNEPGFWNRQASYDRLGFETFWSMGDFVQDDMTSIFLSDASLHRQVAEKLGSQHRSAAGLRLHRHLLRPLDV